MAVTRSHRLLARLVAVTTTILLFAPDRGTAQESAATRISREHLGAVVTIVALDPHEQPLALGSGFFIDTAGSVVTNAHVVEGAGKVLIRWRGRTVEATRISRFDPRHDLVVVGTPLTATPKAPLGDSDTVIVGQEVIALGNPQGLEGSVSTGILSGIRTLNDERYLQITAPISPGSSGGPVFDTKGRAIGVATASLRSGQSLNFALPINLIGRLPSANISFAALMRQPVEGESGQGRDVVYIDNVIERSDWSGLSTLTVSIQNKSNNTLGDFVILVIVKSPNGSILTHHLNHLTYVVVPPGLATQTSLTARAQGYSESGRKGSYEIRILDFKIKRGGSDDTSKRLLK